MAETSTINLNGLILPYFNIKDEKSTDIWESLKNKTTKTKTPRMGFLQKGNSIKFSFYS